MNNILDKGIYIYIYIYITSRICFFGRQNFFLEGTCPYMLTCKERDIHEFCFTQAILEYTTWFKINK